MKSLARAVNEGGSKGATLAHVIMCAASSYCRNSDGRHSRRGAGLLVRTVRHLAAVDADSVASSDVFIHSRFGTMNFVPHNLAAVGAGSDP